MAATLSNIPVRAAVNIEQTTSALSAQYLVEHDIAPNVDGYHHLATLTIQTPDLCVSCPMTFVVVPILQFDVIIGHDWNRRTSTDISMWFAVYDDVTIVDDNILPVHADTPVIHAQSASPVPAYHQGRAMLDLLPQVHCMTKTQLSSLMQRHSVARGPQSNVDKMCNVLMEHFTSSVCASQSSSCTGCCDVTDIVGSRSLNDPLLCGDFQMDLLSVVCG